MVEVFKTNVEESAQAERLVKLLLTHFPDSSVNFDLQDCDRILRVANSSIHPQQIVVLLKREGFQCHLLD